MNGLQSTARRQVLTALPCMAVLPVLTRVAAAAAATAPDEPATRWLELTSTHTGESLKTTYRDANGLVAEAVAALKHLLRDHRTGEAHDMDTGLYDQLTDLAATAGVDPHYEIISGYRSPETNATLRERSTGVSSKSLHMEGRAMDVRLRGVSIARLNELALAMARGGVGYYPGSRFVHLDTGRVRRWEG